MEKPDYYVHPSSYVDEPCQIGAGTKIWHFCHIMQGAQIGSGCILGQNVHIASGVIVGNNVKIQNNVSLFEGVVIEDDVFCGPSCVFTNINNPRSQIVRRNMYARTLVQRGASIGANATIVCGSTIGRYAFIGAGAVVTRSSVPDYALMVGVPANRKGWMSRHGYLLVNPDAEGMMVCPESGWRYKEIAPELLCCLDWDEINPCESQDKEFPGVNMTLPPKVPLLDLKAQYATIRDEIQLALNRVIDSQHFINGPEVEALENEVAGYSQCTAGIGVSSGTDALLVALMALDIKEGDEVVTTPYTFVATMTAAIRLGARPVLVDIDPLTFNLDPNRVEAAVTPKTRAILPVHLFGQMAEMDPLLTISQKYSIPLVEDAAQAIGAEYHARRAGSLGCLGCFSFFPSKNLGGFGDGGMVTTSDPELAQRVKLLRNHGQQPKYYTKVVSGNFRLDELQAAVLRVKLKHLDGWTLGRQQNAQTYRRLLTEAGLSIEPGMGAGGKGVVLSQEVPNRRHIYNQFVIRSARRNELKTYLAHHGIGTEIYYPVPMHLQESFSFLGYHLGDFPLSEQAADQSLALPIYPELTVDMQVRVVEAIADFYSA